MLIFEREITYHLLRTYLPSILFVFVAWFSMFVPLNHVPGEVNYFNYVAHRYMITKICSQVGLR